MNAEQVLLVLRDLLQQRRAVLETTQAGRYFLPQLEERKEEFEQIPPAVLQGLPLAAQLGQTDERHDSLGETIHFVLMAVERFPGATQEDLAVTRTAREHLIPSLKSLREAYSVEASRAQSNHELLKNNALRSKLQSVKFLRTDLLALAESFTQAGLELQSLLTQRAESASTDRSALGALRSASLGLINRLREDIAREFRKDSAKAADLDRQIFSFFDQTQQMANASKSNPRTSTSAPSPASDPTKPNDPTPST